MFERRQHLDPKVNPFFGHAEVQLWLALRDGDPVGRISAQIDQAALAQHKDETGYFGFLEAEDDGESFAALLGAAEAWLKDRGMRRVRGPFSLSINDESGLLIQGFDRPPSIMMGHAPPYYASRLEEQDYAKAMDLIAYEFDVVATNSVPPVVRRLVQDLGRRSNVTIRNLRKSHIDQELKAVLDIFNDAWSNNWGFVPFSDIAIAKLGKDMRPLIREDFVSIVEIDAKPAAFAIALPNLNEVIADLNGALLPFGWAKLLYRLKRGKLRTARMPLMGVRKKYQGGTFGAALAYTVIQRVHESVRRAGFVGGELSWVLEDNLPARKVIEAAGGVPYKTYRIYEKALT
jgi:GNAT superfamily N-acetyltransferase